MKAKNVGELATILKQEDQGARIFTIEPPFDGVKLVKQGDGSFLFCRTADASASHMPSEQREQTLRRPGKKARRR